MDKNHGSLSKQGKALNNLERTKKQRIGMNDLQRTKEQRIGMNDLQKINMQTIPLNDPEACKEQRFGLNERIKERLNSSSIEEQQKMTMEDLGSTIDERSQDTGTEKRQVNMVEAHPDACELREEDGKGEQAAGGISRIMNIFHQCRQLSKVSIRVIFNSCLNFSLFGKIFVLCPERTEKKYIYIYFR